MFLDIAFGYFVGGLIGMPFLGVLFALLPDIDFILHYFNKKVNLWGHRGITHTPFLYMVFSLVLFLAGVPGEIVLLFFVCTQFHLLHDLFVIGRGVMILYPFSTKRLKLFPDNGGAGYLPQKYLWWDELKTPLYTFNTLHNNSWIRDWYLRPNLFLFTETGLGILFLYLSL